LGVARNTVRLLNTLAADKALANVSLSVIDSENTIMSTGNALSDALLSCQMDDNRRIIGKACVLNIKA
jgi:tetrahydromethanopterin S-methyltransferase subunit E